MKKGTVFITLGMAGLTGVAGFLGGTMAFRNENNKTLVVLAEKEDDINNLMSEMEKLEKDIKTQEEQLKTLQSEKDALQKKYDEAVSSNNQEELESLRSQLTSKNEEIESYKTQLQQAQSQYEEINKSYNELNTQYQTLLSQSKIDKQQIQSLNENIAQLNQRISELEGQLGQGESNPLKEKLIDTLFHANRENVYETKDGIRIISSIEVGHSVMFHNTKTGEIRDLGTDYYRLDSFREWNNALYVSAHDSNDFNEWSNGVILKLSLETGEFTKIKENLSAVYINDGNSFLGTNANGEEVLITRSENTLLIIDKNNNCVEEEFNVEEGYYLSSCKGKCIWAENWESMSSKIYIYNQGKLEEVTSLENQINNIYDYYDGCKYLEVEVTNSDDGATKKIFINIETKQTFSFWKDGPHLGEICYVRFRMDDKVIIDKLTEEGTSTIHILDLKTMTTTSISEELKELSVGYTFEDDSENIPPNNRQPDWKLQTNFIYISKASGNQYNIVKYSRDGQNEIIGSFEKDENVTNVILYYRTDNFELELQHDYSSYKRYTYNYETSSGNWEGPFN